jgi:hypothetical protein
MWKQWDDEQGRCFVNMPYVIRQHGSGWRLDGNGLCVDGPDPLLLQFEADQHRAQYLRIAVGAGVPRLPDRPAVNPDGYGAELRDLQLAAKRLRRIVDAVNPYQVRAIAGSRLALEAVRDDLQGIIERLP